MGGRGLRVLLTVVIDVLIVLAVALTVRQFIVFSGQIASQNWALAYDAITKHLVVVSGFSPVKTPYGGIFDVNNALTIVIALAAEWGFSAIRNRA
jgi:hypothetical protein